MSTIAARIYAELQGDKAIWAVLALLTVFSVLAVYSSTGTLAYRVKGGDTEAYLFKHGMILVGGLLLAYLSHLLHYKKYANAAPYLLALSIPLLMYTIGFGPEINEAKRWIQIPFVGITFQSSAFASIALVIYVARAISSKQDYIKDFQSAFIPIIVPILIVCGLIAPADLSTAAVLFFTCIFMMFIGRVALQYIFLLLFLGIALFSMLIALGEFFPETIRVKTWISRVIEFTSDPDGVYQVRQAKIAIANGEFFGLGPGNSIQRNFLPSPYSDFIYAIICEEYGVIGGIVVIGLYLLLMFRVTRLVTKSPKAFGAMLAIGLAVSMVLQAFFNIAVSVNLIPVTGLTLPMISMGGTSILFTCISFGMILSVSKYIESVANE
ncbi:MAG: FtsW/RodA/SpoVE family cell cycle protein [Saprospiraceae bacterium]|nr:FtsW/RodA/SpoVE family cell cycle protein [Saprospiraceae bacterium]